MEDLNVFREEIAGWLAANLPANWQDRMRGATESEHVVFQREWFRALKSGGYIVPHWPRSWGGGEMSFAKQIVLYEEIARAGAPRLVLYFISLFHAPSTLLEWGSKEQKQQHLPVILEGDEIWCQGFSEPNAGSDLASLQTRAIRKGDHYVVTGQKTWSSSAHLARYCLLLARTDPEASKHKGISYFILDLQSPGVTRRSIKMITGESHFNEIFLDEVEIPAENLIGAENNGWTVAQATLTSERGLTILELSERLRMSFRLLLKEALSEKPVGGRLIDDDEIRRSLVDIYARTSALRSLVSNMLANVQVEGSAGTAPSMIKVYYSQLLRDFTALGTRLGGIDTQYWQPLLMGGGYETGDWMHDLLYSWSWSIAGGSNEVQYNIISERGLGLPREPKAN
jgi:alkylation response protein AidB-like acyl-CoA dehydrogenase